MLLKNINTNTKKTYFISLNKDGKPDVDKLTITEHINNENTSFDLLLTTDYNQLSTLCETFNSNLVLFYSDTDYNQLPEHCFILSPPLYDNLKKQFTNIINFLSIIKARNAGTHLIALKEKEDFLGNHIGEGLFVTNMDGNINFYNKRFEQMFTTPKPILHQNISRILNSKLNYSFVKRWEDNTDPVSSEVKSIQYNGIKYYNVTYTPIFDEGQLKNICGIIREITKQKSIEQKLKESHIKMADVNKKLVSVQHAIIMGFSKLSEYKDKETGAHLERIQNYVKVLAYESYKRILFVDFKTKQNYLSEDYVEELSISSLLHDIGKVGIPDNILTKPERLTREEYTYMQQHTKIGGDTLKYLNDIVGEKSFLALAKEIAYYHHERWNGKGYPFGLKHNEIPLSARIIAICDVYDALTSERPYKSPYSHEKACEIIYDLSGIHFDPIIISVFSTVERQFKIIRNKFCD